MLFKSLKPWPPEGLYKQPKPLEGLEGPYKQFSYRQRFQGTPDCRCGVVGEDPYKQLS